MRRIDPSATRGVQGATDAGASGRATEVRRGIAFCQRLEKSLVPAPTSAMDRFISGQIDHAGHIDTNIEAATNHLAGRTAGSDLDSSVMIGLSA